MKPIKNMHQHIVFWRPTSFLNNNKSLVSDAFHVNPIFLQLFHHSALDEINSSGLFLWLLDVCCNSVIHSWLPCEKHGSLIRHWTFLDRHLGGRLLRNHDHSHTKQGPFTASLCETRVTNQNKTAIFCCCVFSRAPFYHHNNKTLLAVMTFWRPVVSPLWSLASMSAFHTAILLNHNFLPLFHPSSLSFILLHLALKKMS